jgi:hypothetical protein
MGGDVGGRAGGGVSLSPASALRQINDTNLDNICEKIKREITLTPLKIIEDLCEGRSPSPICLSAVFIDEVNELAKKLNRQYLLMFEVC